MTDDPVDVMQDPLGMDNDLNQDDDDRDEILEEDLDDNALNKKIKDMFDVDLTELT